MEPDPLAELAAAAVAGDRRAVEQLCRALEGPVYRLALRVLGHPEDARDAATRHHPARAYTLATRHLLRAN